jgi:hypothetical protein
VTPVSWCPGPPWTSSSAVGRLATSRRTAKSTSARRIPRSTPPTTNRTSSRSQEQERRGSRARSGEARQQLAGQFGDGIGAKGRNDRVRVDRFREIRCLDIAQKRLWFLVLGVTGLARARRRTPSPPSDRRHGQPRHSGTIDSSLAALVARRVPHHTAGSSRTPPAPTRSACPVTSISPSSTYSTRTRPPGLQRDPPVGSS